MPEHVGVALAVHEGEARAVAPDVVAVGRAEAVVPVPVLVGHGGMHLPEVRAGRDGRAEERLGDDVGEPAVAGVVQVAAVECEPFGAAREELERRRVEIDERGVGLLRGEAGGRGVRGEVGVVLRAVGEVRVARALEGDRAEEHEPHRPALLGPQRAIVRDRLHEILPVRVRPRRSGIRLVVAEEHEDHARIDEIEVGGIGDEALLARPHGDRVAGHAEVAKPHVEPDELALEHRLHPWRMLHAVREPIAVDCHRVALLKREGRGSVGGTTRRRHATPDRGGDEAGDRQPAGRDMSGAEEQHRRGSQGLWWARRPGTCGRNQFLRHVFSLP